MNAKPSLTLVRRMKASPAKVYAAWTEPERMAKWWGSPDMVVESAEADPRVGGRFRIVVRQADGERHDVSGAYSEVEPERKLSFSWAWVTMPERESRVTVTLRPVGEGTELTLLHEQFADETARDNHEKGWSRVLGQLQEFVEKWEVA